MNLLEIYTPHELTEMSIKDKKKKKRVKRSWSKGSNIF